jgi:hypothetical protein
MLHRAAALLSCAAVLAASAHAEDARKPDVFKSAVTGKPVYRSLDALDFGPGGILLIGDGLGRQVLAVETGDTAPAAAWTAPIDRIDEKIAGRLGADAKGVAILDMAVNPASGRAYVAVRKEDDKSLLILTVDGAGRIEEFAPASVRFAAVPLGNGSASTLNKVTDVAWAGDRVLAAGRANEEFACKMFVAAVPLAHESAASVYSAETYHVSHRKWETKAPMSTVLPFEQNGKRYMVGAFSCTPVVKYRLDDLTPDAKVKGVSVVELGSGNRPLDMIAYEKGGKSFVLVNTFRFHHAKKPFGPSPYWTVRLDADLLAEDAEVNEKAANRLGKSPAAAKMTMVEAYHGVVEMSPLDKERALVLRRDPKTEVLSLAPLPLP